MVMRMSELISVICSVKNGENTIAGTISSVINQSYTNWEMIIVDDGSTDKTVDILKYYNKKDDRIKPYFTEGIGRGKALNKAIDLSKGKYIANIDADDLMHPKKLEIQVKFLNKNDYFLIGTQSILVYNDNKPVWTNNVSENPKLYKVGKNLLIRNEINHSSVLINKKKLIQIGKYNENRKTQFDYDLWLRALLYNMDLVIIREKLTAKRIHSNQSFENKKRLIYTINSSLLQLKYILKSKKYIYLLPIPIISLLLSQLPFKYRRLITKILFNS